jgi:hypothetical protein
MRRLRVSLVLLASALLALPCRRAQAAELPPAKQALLLARVIAYDAKLAERAGKAVDIGVLVKSGNRDSERMADLIIKAFSPLESTTLVGLPLRIVRLSFAGREVLDRTVQDRGIDTLYVCTGLEANLADIKAVARARKVLTVGSQEAQVKQGLSLGMFVVGGKKTIVVNLQASREEGVVFAPELLRLATIVR